MLPASMILHGRKIFQSSWVVPDLEAAMAAWKHAMGVGPFTLIRPVYEVLTYRGVPTEANFTVAMAQGGDVQIELICPDDGNPSVYRDLVPAGQSGFHHVAIMAEDFDQDIAAFARQGFRPAMEGTRNGKRMAYVDTSPTIGCMVELLEPCPVRQAFFDRVAQAAVDWDGGGLTVGPADHSKGNVAG